RHPGALAAREDAEREPRDVPREEADDAQAHGEARAARVRPEREPEAAVEHGEAAERHGERREVGETGHRRTTAGAPDGCSRSGRRLAARKPSRSGAGSGRAEVSPSSRFATSSALMRHIGSPTPGIVPPPAW